MCFHKENLISPVDLTIGQKIEGHQAHDLDGLEIGVFEDCSRIYGQQSSSSEVDDMVACVAFPFHVRQVRVFGANGKDEIENREPFVGRSLYRTTEDMSNLPLQIQPSDHWK
jgi:hypothetical protein